MKCQEEGAPEAAATEEGARAEDGAGSSVVATLPAATSLPTKASAAAVTAAATLTVAEKKEKGDIKKSVYTEYFRAANATHLAVLVLFLYCAQQLNSIANDWWLSIWSEGTAFPTWGTNAYLLGFIFLGFSLGLLVFVRALAFMVTGLRASNRLHQRLTSVVMQGTMAFFDTTPLGRILARFASDMNKIDESLPQAVE
ncbi:hypothetical protein T492DRAFT_880819, partial [Pavlovales sp. CCMP2436]